MTLPQSDPHATNESPAAVGRLIARERVKAMEALAATIAREIRPTVLGLTSASQLLRYSLPQEPVTEKSLGRILQESERLNVLHEALTEYATEVPPRLLPIIPDGIWSDVLLNLRGALEANSIVVTHMRADRDVQVLGDVEQLARAMERMIHHAVDRVPPRSTVSITSAIDADGMWRSTLRAVGQPGERDAERPLFDRSTFMLALANRTAIAHGGDVVEHHDPDASLLVSIRLPVEVAS